MNSRSNKRNTTSKKKWLYIGLTIAAVVLITGAIIGYNYWSNEQRKQQANETAESFIETLENQDYEQLSNLTASTSLDAIDYTPEDVQERYTTIFSGIGVTDITAENIQLSEDEETGEFGIQYDLHMETSLGELEPQSYQTALQETEEGFTVHWNTDLIFPEMEPGDTIRISFETGERGNIFDQAGELLAGKSSAWQAGLYPAALGEGEEREENIEIIAETFEMTTGQLENLLSASWVTEETFVPFTIVDEGETLEVPGVLYQETTTRSYPLGEAGAHLIGYTGEVFAEDLEEDPTLQPGDIIGKSGLEATFDERLRGNRGGIITILNQEGEEKSVLQEAPVKDGEDIHLTIKASLQEEYYNGFDGESGAAVVTDPTSGELLVLTSSPSYNPTLMSRGISAEAYQEYAENEEAPFLPRYTARYAPGSTFKAITAAIGLDEGTTTLDESHTITGYEWQPDESWGDSQVTRVSNQPTEVNLEDAFVYSDNIFFAQEALEMGAETFENGLMQFPFDDSFNLPIRMESAQISNSGLLDNEILLADTAFGQGQLLMSPLQQAVFYSPFANDGELVYPKLELKEGESQESTQPITQESANIVSSLLVSVVEDPLSSTHTLNDSARTLAAKTGTTEVQSMEEEDSNEIDGFLLAYDAEEQTFLSLILVEGGWGSDVVEQFAPILEQH